MLVRVAAWRAFLAHAGDDPWNAMLLPQVATTNLAPGGSATLATRSGPGWLRGIRLHLPRSAYAALNLRVSIDGVLALDVPLADFFAAPTDAQAPARGVFVGEDAGGWLYAWWPMPFVEDVAIDSALVFDTSPVPAEAGRFEARLVDTCSAASAITLDHG